MGITEWIATTAVAFIAATSYPGIFLLMVLESMVFPVPSEAVMPFAGFLIVTGLYLLILLPFIFFGKGTIEKLIVNRMIEQLMEKEEDEL